MTIVHEIFDALGGATRIAEAIGVPMKTVHSWKLPSDKRPANIPPWRRPAVLMAAQRARKELSPEALAYLASSDRAPRSAA